MSQKLIDNNQVWVRKGRICGKDSWDLEWHTRNTMFAFPHLLNNDRLRLYLTLCDSENRGRLGYVDVNPDNPSEIIDYSKEPLLDIGRTGYFDENGVVSTAILEDSGKIYIYYCGYQKQVNYPYSVLAGVAISEDGGYSFSKMKETPLLERTDGEMFLRTGVGIYKFGDIYRLYYASGNDWISVKNKLVPKYSFKYIDSNSPISFDGKSNALFPLENEEFGMTSPQIFACEGGYDMIYSLRTTDGYGMGYAFSQDGINFIRNDKVMSFKRPVGAFDSEMVCYGKCYKHGERTYLFYSGNHYGMDGIGWAELKEI